jgi:hypothetical protein
MFPTPGRAYTARRQEKDSRTPGPTGRSSPTLTCSNGSGLWQSLLPGPTFGFARGLTATSRPRAEMRRDRKRAGTGKLRLRRFTASREINPNHVVFAGDHIMIANARLLHVAIPLSSFGVPLCYVTKIVRAFASSTFGKVSESTPSFNAASILF